jgi:SMC interacting uncharacterized protein involved in chromosome segregation
MLSTPKPNRGLRKSLGEPSRISRLRTQSPGGASADSDDLHNVPATSPRRWLGGGSIVGASTRHGARMVPTARNSRDPRPVGDRSYAAQCARRVVELLTSCSYGKMISHEKLLKDPSSKEFFDIFKFLIAQLDPQLLVDGKLEDEVPLIMRRLKYPVEVNRSKLSAISGPNTWPQLLAVLDWLCILVRINKELVEPLAACELGLSDVHDSEHDIGDHQLLRSLHQNYLEYLSGSNDHSDEERLRQIYEERISSMRDEIKRIRTLNSLIHTCHLKQNKWERRFTFKVSVVQSDSPGRPEEQKIHSWRCCESLCSSRLVTASSSATQ